MAQGIVTRLVAVHKLSGTYELKNKSNHLIITYLYIIVTVPLIYIYGVRKRVIFAQAYVLCLSIRRKILPAVLQNAYIYAAPITRKMFTGVIVLKWFIVFFCFLS